MQGHDVGAISQEVIDAAIDDRRRRVARRKATAQMQAHQAWLDARAAAAADPNLTDAELLAIFSTPEPPIVETLRTACTLATDRWRDALPTPPDPRRCARAPRTPQQRVRARRRGAGRPRAQASRSCARSGSSGSDDPGSSEPPGDLAGRQQTEALT